MGDRQIVVAVCLCVVVVVVLYQASKSDIQREHTHGQLFKRNKIKHNMIMIIIIDIR